ncbi:MAG TPA: WbqC family protein [Flavobacteriaceae bacterium]|nr:WbqC family protein [Flavobacteriaceae bacterium]
MQKTLINPGYFAPIDLFSAYINAKTVLWENEDNYQKQTYRNRQYIYSPNGKLLLNIPIDHTTRKSGASKYRDTKVENKYDWQRVHWKSLETAYSNSPFFEFYQDEFAALYHQPVTYLLDFNFRCLEVLKSCLQIEQSERLTQKFYKTTAELPSIKDLRFLIVAKRKPAISLEVYDQVFQEKHGFIPNLSILDLLFNKGPESLSYLKRNAVHI